MCSWGKLSWGSADLLVAACIGAPRTADDKKAILHVRFLSIINGRMFGLPQALTLPPNCARVRSPDSAPGSAPFLTPGCLFIIDFNLPCPGPPFLLYSLTPRIAFSSC